MEPLGAYFVVNFVISNRVIYLFIYLFIYFNSPHTNIQMVKRIQDNMQKETSNRPANLKRSLRLRKHYTYTKYKIHHQMDR